MGSGGCGRGLLWFVLDLDSVEATIEDSGDDKWGVVRVVSSTTSLRGFPCLVFGGGGFFRGFDTEVSATSLCISSSEFVNSFEVRGESNCASGIGSKIDCREIEDA